jgi:hypothetical protein
MGEKDKQVNLNSRIKIEVKYNPILDSFWSEKLEERFPRNMQIRKMTISCANCGANFEMTADRKYVDVLREIEIWIGDCTSCFTTNAFTFRVMDESYRIPSPAVIARRKAEAEGKKLEPMEWENDR